MKRYKEYKDSGVKWIGEIPGHWKCTRIKFIANLYGRIGFRGYNSKDLNKEGIGAITLSPSNMKDMMMDYTNVTYLSWEKYNESPEIMIQQGDILFVKTGSSYGKSCYVDNLPQEATINPQILRINPLINGRFLCYYFNSSLARTFTECGVVGGTIPTISQEKVGNFIALNPPLSEQQAIVSYLDSKVSKIDEYISAAEKKIAALEELKQSLIAEAVTRGINPNVPMKESGVKWIGRVPEHWEVSSLRAYLKLYSEKNHPSKPLLSVTREKGVIIRDTESKEENHNFIPDDLSGYKLVRKGDFVINKMKSWQGSYGVSKYEGIVSPAYYICGLRFPYKEFFSIAIRSKAYVPFFTQFSKGIRVDQWDLSTIALKNIPFFAPPLPEQQAIVAYIDTKTAQIDRLCQSERSQIEKLKEYKQRLISDVVTGKVDVS